MPSLFVFCYIRKVFVFFKALEILFQDWKFLRSKVPALGCFIKDLRDFTWEILEVLAIILDIFVKCMDVQRIDLMPESVSKCGLEILRRV